MLVLSSSSSDTHGKSGDWNQFISPDYERRTNEFRTLYLNGPGPSPHAEAFYLRSDGTRVNCAITRDKGRAALRIDMRPLDGSRDGVFTVYVVDRSVEQGVLQVRIAKLYQINRTVRRFWPKAFFAERLRARSCPVIPLEITAGNLWDESLRNSAQSGDIIPFTILSHGRPLSSELLRVRSGTGWTSGFMTDKEGAAQVQLIRDYYPEEWSQFKRNQRMSLLAIAEKNKEESGVFGGQPYTGIHYSSTLPWNYRLQRDEYSSYAGGIGVAACCSLGIGYGVLFYRERRRSPYREIIFDEKD